MAVTGLHLNAVPAQAATTERVLNVVQLGDSYSAGNGAGDYYGPKGAFRSYNSWARKYASWLNSRGVNATLDVKAFSGTQTPDIVNQADTIANNTDLVMFTAGGNDVNFGEIVSSCFAVGFRDPGECRKNVENAFSKLGDVKQGNLNVLNAIEARNLASTDQIIMVGYPLLSQKGVDYVLERCYDDLCLVHDRYDAGAEIRRLGQEATKVQQGLVA